MHPQYKPKERLDLWLLAKYPDYSRAFLQKLCNTDKVLIDGQPQKSGYRITGEEKVEVLHDMESIVGVTPDIDLPIIYEDNNVVVVNKPSGILSHGLSKFLGEPSVASFLRQKVKADKDWNNDDIRFGIVHRLDRVTSGVMICAKNQKTMRHLQQQFHDRKTVKTYVAIAEGEFKQKAAILDLPIERNPKAPSTFRVGANGKESITKYHVKNVFEKDGRKYSTVELEPQTGRTHQLRVHLKHLGHSIVGDVLYGTKGDRLYLHAYKLAIDIPEKGVTTFKADLPKDFEDFTNA